MINDNSDFEGSYCWYTDAATGVACDNEDWCWMAGEDSDYGWVNPQSNYDWLEGDICAVLRTDAYDGVFPSLHFYPMEDGKNFADFSETEEYFSMFDERASPLIYMIEEHFDD